VLKNAGRWREPTLVLGAYLVLAMLLTYPLALSFLTHVPGDGGDDPAIVWNLWWVKHALLDLHTNPFQCDYLFYPIGINLAFYTLTFLNGLLSIPFQGILEVVGASNLILILSSVLGAYGTYLLAKDLMIRSRHRVEERRFIPCAAFLAGLVFAFSSSRMLYISLGQFNISSTHWIPFCVLFLVRMRRRPERWRYSALAGIFLLFAGWTEFTFASFLAIFMALYLLTYLVSDPGSVLNGRFLAGVGITGGIFLIGMSPILASMIQEMAVEGDYLMAGMGFADVFSADLAGFFVPSQLHPLLQNLEKQVPFSYVNFMFLGYTVLGLSALGAWRNPTARPWALWGIVFAVLALGPLLQVGGKPIDLPLPFRLLQSIPFLKGNRYPSRFSVMIGLCLAVLCAHGSAAILSWIARKRLLSAVSTVLVAVLLPAVLLFEHLSVPLPMTPLMAPASYQTKLPRDDRSPLLEIPLGWRNGFRITGAMDTIIMFQQYYQTVHRRPILGGNTSRNPELKFQYFTESPILNTIIALEGEHEVDSTTLERDRILAPRFLRFFGIRYAIIHEGEVSPSLLEYAINALDLMEIHRDDGVVLYKAPLSSLKANYRVPLGDPLAKLNLAEGWGMDQGSHIWAQRQVARLFLPLPAREPLTLAFRALSPGTGQAVDVFINGHHLGREVLPPEWVDRSVTIPGDYLNEGLNEFSFSFSRLFPVNDTGIDSFQIGDTGVRSPVDILVRSAGMGFGDFGHIYHRGQDISLGDRGYNVAVIDPISGRLESQASFDTFADDVESSRMASFISQIEPGKIVAVAVRDEASRMLTPEAVRALRSIGATEDLRDRFRSSHAIIGVKGAGQGEAMEVADPTGVASIGVGAWISEPALAAAFSHIQVDALPVD
jgi:hypothetical protein